MSKKLVILIIKTGVLVLVTLYISLIFTNLYRSIIVGMEFCAELYTSWHKTSMLLQISISFVKFTDGFWVSWKLNEVSHKLILHKIAYIG
jgi:hypothetical protein